MKKLLIVAALVLSASFVHAAGVNWSGYGVATSTGVATDTTGWKVTLMDSSVTSIESLKTAFDSNDYSAIAKAITDGSKGTAANVASLVTGVSFNGTSGTIDTTQSGSFYVLFTDTTLADNSTGHYVVTEAKAVSATELGSGDLSFGDLSTQTASWTVYQTGTAAIPEPTSAMLLMLGMAGLALRRRARKA